MEDKTIGNYKPSLPPTELHHEFRSLAGKAVMVSACISSHVRVSASVYGQVDERKVILVCPVGIAVEVILETTTIPSSIPPLWGRACKSFVPSA
jgi:hypothetical protein